MNLSNTFKVPDSFTVGNQFWRVVYVEHLDDNNFGELHCVKQEIVIARNVWEDGTLIPLNEEQIKNTFFHELIHCFNWNMNTECDETLAQVFANYFCELISSSKYETD